MPMIVGIIHTVLCMVVARHWLAILKGLPYSFDIPVSCVVFNGSHQTMRTHYFADIPLILVTMNKKLSVLYGLHIGFCNS